MLSLIKKVGSFLVPGIGPALKFGPWIASGILFAAVLIEHSQVVAADAGIRAAQAQTVQVISKCQAEVSTEAATESAHAVAQMQSAQRAADEAMQQLQRQRAAAQMAAKAGESATQAQIAHITAQAAQTGQDGPIPPVLAEMFP